CVQDLQHGKPLSGLERGGRTAPSLQKGPGGNEVLRPTSILAARLAGLAGRTALPSRGVAGRLGRAVLPHPAQGAGGATSPVALGSGGAGRRLAGPGEEKSEREVSHSPAAIVSRSGDGARP